MQEWLLDGAPTGCQVSCIDNGWIKGVIFLQWVQFVFEQVRPTATRVLLVLDNHKSHMYIKALAFAMGNNVYACHSHLTQQTNAACSCIWAIKAMF